MKHVARPLAVLACLVHVAGCGPARPARVAPPPLDPGVVTAAVFEKADGDGDGTLAGAELSAIPALVAAVPRLDTDRDGGVSRAELRGWLDAVRNSRVAITRFDTVVTHLGKPLANATIRLVPEPFMGSGMQIAEGVTGTTGEAAVEIPGAKYPGVNCGLYRVEITGRGNDGSMLPSRYNTETTLGAAVGAALPEAGMAFFTLE